MVLGVYEFATYGGNYFCTYLWYFVCNKLDRFSHISDTIVVDHRVSGVAAIFGVLYGTINFKSAVYGVVVGSIIPLALIGLTYLITKRQGMGYGDIQLGFVLGIWLGPVRMALTLFGASLLSLIVWLILSAYKRV